jgi:hypothetical protein
MAVIPARTRGASAGLHAGCERALGTLAPLAVIFLAALFAYAPIFAVDFFWHLKLGEQIAQQRAIPQVDLFSAVHPERPWVQFQWLWELLAYGAHALYGLRGVRALQALTLALSFGALWLASRRLLQSRALAFCFCALALVVFEDRIQARPSATALGFVALNLPLLLDAHARGQRFAPTTAFFVACAWSNVHAGESLLMPLCFGALAAGSALTYLLRVRVEGSDRMRTSPAYGALRRDTIMLVVTCAGLALSPALWTGFSHWLRAIGPQLASHNKEWQPSYSMLDNGVSPSHLLIALGPSLVALAYVLQQGRSLRAVSADPRPWSEWIMCAGLLVLAHQAVRNAFLLLVPLCFMLRRMPRPLPARQARLAVALAVVLLGAAAHDHLVVGYGGLSQVPQIVREDLAPQAFPTELASFMREAKIEGGVLNDGRWGGYLIWALWPACHVFVDTRQNLTAEMWPVFLASQHAHARHSAMQTAFARWGVELTAFRGPTFASIEPEPDWQLLFKAGDQELYQHRRGVHARANVERARAWVAQRVDLHDLTRDYEAAATAVGAQIWLQAPAQQRLHARAQVLSRSGSDSDLRQALAIESGLQFDAGRYEHAYALLAQLSRRDPDDTHAHYRLALAAYASGDTAGCRRALDMLARKVDQLSTAQRGRLAAIEKRLALRR